MANPIQRLFEMRRAAADRNVGLLAEFSDPGALYEAIVAARKAGYRRLDTFSPFPIHGMDKAMGLGNSPLGFIVLGAAATGLGLSVLMQWWMADSDYPLWISGKPFFAIEFAMPVMFELTVLFAAFGAVGGMFALNALPKPYNPLFYSTRFERVTDDAFFMHVEARDDRFDRRETARLLKSLGALHIEYIDHEGATPVVVADSRGGAEPPPPHTTGAI
jgi:hypothetical protein